MKQAVLVVLAVVAVVGGIVFGISRVADVSSLDQQGDGRSDTQQTEQEKAAAWDADAKAAFGGIDLTQQVIDMVDSARKWLAGERPPESFEGKLEARTRGFADLRARLAALRPFPYDKRVVPLYRASADLYSQVVTVYQAMVETVGPNHDLTVQLDLIARRIRALADRVFDRGRELVKPKLHETPSPDVEIRLPEEVPNWVQEGLAPGPPLDDAPPPAATEPQLRQPSRPDQPRIDWVRALQVLDAPTPKAIQAASEGHDPAVLQSQARALVATVEKLRTTPDPKDDREEGARIRLSLLVDSEAARAFQYEAVSGAVRLRQAGDVLLRVGETLWSGPGLPERPVK
ncbi:MAG: hypothetical protein QOI20_1268 [Acidimicrobiaceae bacterium]|nr:hypothetical protein [Acidimicrobiaceae bacterium]